MLIAGVFLLATAAIYFRANITSVRDFKSWQQMVGRGRSCASSEAEYCNYVRRIGPLSLYDPRVLFLAAIVAAPVVLYPLLKESFIYGPVVALAAGAFISPLLAPTSIEPSPADLRFLPLFVAKWSLGKLDVYAKLALAGAFIWLISKIAPIGRLLHVVGATAFPVVGTVTDIEGNVIDVGPIGTLVDIGVILLAGMMLVRISMFAAHGYAYTSAAIMATSWIWVQYQWIFEEQLRGINSVAWFTNIPVLMLLSDLFLTIGVAMAEAFSEERHTK